MMIGLFGPPFAEAASSLAVLVWVLPLTMLSGHARWSLIAAGRQSRVLWAQLAGAAIDAAKRSHALIPSNGGPRRSAGPRWSQASVVWWVAHAFAGTALDEACHLWPQQDDRLLLASALLAAS